MHRSRCDDGKRLNDAGSKKRQPCPCANSRGFLSTSAGTATESSVNALLARLLAPYMMTISCAGISSRQVAVEIGTTPKCVWHLFQRIRESRKARLNAFDCAENGDQICCLSGGRSQRVIKEQRGRRETFSKGRVLGINPCTSGIGQPSWTALRNTFNEHVHAEVPAYTDERREYHRFVNRPDAPFKLSSDECASRKARLNLGAMSWIAVKSDRGERPRQFGVNYTHRCEISFVERLSNLSADGARRFGHSVRSTFDNRERYEEFTT